MKNNLCALVLLVALIVPYEIVSSPKLDYDAMARRIVSSLKLWKGERIVIRYASGYFGELVAPLRRRIREAGAIDLAAIEYAETDLYRNSPFDGLTGETVVGHRRSEAFEQLLDAVDAYIWLPQGQSRGILPAEGRALQRWLDKGATRREIHFHWSAGSVQADGLPSAHTAALDSVLQNALDIDYAALSAAQDRAIALLRSGPVHVQTPAGTNLTFRVGNRPFNKQNGDASPGRMRTARVRVDREIELPAGVVRVAPLEETVRGSMVIPVARFGQKVVRNLRMQFEKGKITRIEADENRDKVESTLGAGDASARSFREFGLGFNPKLRVPSDSRLIVYYGYGAGVVRLSLGGNQELGGSVEGEFVRWFFFTDATVEVDGKTLVRRGQLLEDFR